VPFGGFDDFEDCLDTMVNEEGHDEESAQNICGALQAEAKSDNGDPERLLEALREGSGLVADVGVDLVSGVDVPAVDSKWVMLKSGGGRRGHDYRVDTPVLLKDDGDSEKRISYAAAMIPREPDKEGDVVPTPTVENAAHDFLKNDGGIDTDHSLIDGDGDPVESWVLKEERTFELPGGGEETYPAGTWMLGIEWAAEAWDRIKSGELTGLSIYGMAEHVPLERAATCVECNGTLSAAKSESTDSGKREASDNGDMGEQPDGDGADAGGDDADGPTIGEVAASVEDLAEAVESVKDTVETEKQEDPQEAATVLADEYDIEAGDVLEVVAATAEEGADTVLQAIDSLDAGADEVANENGDGDEEEDDDETEKSVDDVPMEKGATGEGAREAQIESKQAGDSAGAGVPSYAEAAENYGGNQ
jgi:hypothetical protein